LFLEAIFGKMDVTKSLALGIRKLHIGGDPKPCRRCQIMKLYYFWITRSVRCEWLINHMGIPCEMIEVNLREDAQLSDEFRAINPFAKIPVLQDGELTLTESFAICTYLGDKFPELKLIPTAGTKERGLHDQWMSFCSTELDQALWRISKHSFVYPEVKRSSAEIQNAKDDFRIAAEILDQHLSSHKFMLGNQLQVVDFVMAHTLLWSRNYKTTVSLGMVTGFKHIQRYLDEMTKLPSIPKELKSVAFAQIDGAK
jgi:glutathione S-transferase